MNSMFVEKDKKKTSFAIVGMLLMADGSVRKRLRECESNIFFFRVTNPFVILSLNIISVV